MPFIAVTFVHFVVMGVPAEHDVPEVWARDQTGFHLASAAVPVLTPACALVDVIVF